VNRAIGVALLCLVALAGVGPGLAATGAPTAADRPARVTAQDAVNGTTIVHEGDRLTVRSGVDQTIRGETTLSPGTPLQVRVRSADTGSPFLLTGGAEVTDFGTFNATFDFHTVPANTTFQVTVLRNGTALAETTGVVRPCEREACEYVPTPTDGTPTEATPAADAPGVADTVEARHGGTATVPLTFGSTGTLTVRVDAPFRDLGGLTAVVTDTDGDGRETLRLRTGEVGPGEHRVRVRTNNATHPATVTNATVEGMLDPAEYDLAVYEGRGTDGNPVDVGTLVVFATDGSTATAAGTDAEPLVDGRAESGAIPGVAALALGGLLAVVGIGLLFGTHRS